MDTTSAAVVLAGLIALNSAEALAQIQAPPREVRRVYWELVQSSEVFVRLIPENSAGNAPLVSLTFRAYFPGRARRDPYTGLPEWPTGAPARLTVAAEPLPLILVRELSLQLVIDGSTIDLTGPTSHYRVLPCLVASEDCVPNAVEAELEPSILRSFVTASSVRGKALGFPVRIVAADQAAVRAFAARVGLATNGHPER